MRPESKLPFEIVEDPPAPKAVAVKVDEMKILAGTGPLKAFATVTIAEKVRIHGFRVIAQESKTPWVSPPQNEVRPKDGGKSKYFPVIEILDEKLKGQI